MCVFDLIAKDSFRRFILTPAFSELLLQADEEELMRIEKQIELVPDTGAVIDKDVKALNARSDAEMRNLLSGGGMRELDRSSKNYASALLFPNVASQPHSPHGSSGSKSASTTSCTLA
jgi:hypothetical protein